ncbi:MAG: methyltransferase domain-containing protein [Isosphaeraceae bacterium]|nr:methyltransferase domain-containing protein [Isosphaeraceae bacterium]
MESPEYETMFRAEEDHWWYRGLRDIVFSEIDRLALRDRAVILLDAGCGTGKTLEVARAHGIDASGFDLSERALAFAVRRIGGSVARASILRPPFADGSFSIVVSNDVLCCLAPADQVVAMRGLARLLARGGRLIVNLPAHPSLSSSHDRAVHIETRYTRRGLSDLLESAGLEAEILTHRNTVLLPIAAAVRLFRRFVSRGTEKPPRSDLRPAPEPLNSLLATPLLLENRLIRLGARFPLGLSIYCVAHRRGERERVAPEAPSGGGGHESS